MPCAKLHITNEILSCFKKNVNNTCIYFSGSTVVIPIITIGTRVPFKPKGATIAQLIIHCNLFKKINKKKFENIIKKFNRDIHDGFICKNNKNDIINSLIYEVKLFIKYIGIVMKWEDFNEDDYRFFIQKTNYWNYL
jgi:hypothetical protein